ncbi:MAG: hypothetical protein FWD49_07760 [Firmicutes bacterium]|nr:hypothetical protein [Bacillota bacterium]
MRIYRYTPTLPPKAEGWGYEVWCVCLAFPWVAPTVMHILPASGQLRNLSYTCRKANIIAFAQ